MANLTFTILRSCKRLPSSQIRHFSKFRKSNSTYKTPLVLGASVTGLICWQLFKTRRKTTEFLPVIHAAQEAGDAKKSKAVTYRQERFYQFASTEFNGNPYMTPQDFLESVTEERPRPRIGRTRLTQKEVDNWLKNTPTRSKGSSKLFRNIHAYGLISYTEYLFLLCVLTKPKSGFHIAFNMFDTDGNQIVDKKEFLVLESFFTLPPQERKFVPRQPQKLETLLAELERVFSKQEPDNAQVTENPGKTDVKSIEPIHDTTLLRHFFGAKGKDVLRFKDFANFMENLQDEVLEIEFMEFSRGMATISEEDFARILLRYTMLDKGDIETCINRVRERMPQEKGLSFKEFKEFCQFLNSLDDFAIAMKMYTYAQQPVSKEQFQRAVKVCTGNVLSPHLVNTVFQIFDEDGDGHLSHKEFISIMKDRLHRGSRSHLMHTSDHWAAFKTCVKNEVKSY